MISTSSVVSVAAQPNSVGASANTILFLASQGAMYQGLVHAMQMHLPEYLIVLVERLPDPSLYGTSVRLMLLDLGSTTECASMVAACREQFPSAALGLVMRNAEDDPADCTTLFDRCEVQGLLPLDLKLEVWLAAMSLLVQGGEYYPPELSRRVHRAEQDGESHLPRQQIEYQPMPHGSHHIAVHLTKRERQVLELLSEGYQNKLIANQMALSEHTVKVHVHNLITKMRVSNRTQAAAAFRSGRYAPVQERQFSTPAFYAGRG